MRTLEHCTHSLSHLSLSLSLSLYLLSLFFLSLFRSRYVLPVARPPLQDDVSLHFFFSFLLFIGSFPAPRQHVLFLCPTPIPKRTLLSLSLRRYLYTHTKSARASSHPLVSGIPFTARRRRRLSSPPRPPPPPRRSAPSRGLRGGGCRGSGRWSAAGWARPTEAPRAGSKRVFPPCRSWSPPWS